jgi:hypothetical protein
MNQELRLAEEFGPHLADGNAAAAFRMKRIEPYVEISPRIVLDFNGVRNANSSFMNALIAGLVEQHGRKVLEVLEFKGCIPVIRVLVEGAISLGLRKIEGRIDA